MTVPRKPVTLAQHVRHPELALAAQCGGCLRIVALDIAALVAKHGIDFPIREVSAHLVCSICGSRDAHTWVVAHCALDLEHPR